MKHNPKHFTDIISDLRRMPLDPEEKMEMESGMGGGMEGHMDGMDEMPQDMEGEGSGAHGVSIEIKASPKHGGSAHEKRMKLMQKLHAMKGKV